VERTHYSDFSAALHRQVAARRVPANGAIEVTRRCPLACAHCYNNLPAQDTRARAAELTFDDHRRILDEITAAGCLWLLYTGGEIFARSDFLDIYTYAKRKGLLVTLFTNGTLITPRIADHLARWRPFCIEITIYGAAAQTHDRITGVPGSYEQCLRGVGLLMERGLPLALKTMALTLNQREIPAMKRFVEEELGLRFRFDAMLNCRVDCSQGPLAVRLPPRGIVELDIRDPKRAAEWRKLAERTFGRVSPPNDEIYHCGAGINFFAVDPYGKLTPCLLSQTDAYDLRTGSFAEGWKTTLREVRCRERTRTTKCVACEMKAMCGMCPPNGQLENGDPEEPVDFLCRVAHLRAHALGLDIPPHGGCEYCKTGVAYEELIRGTAVSTNDGLADSVGRRWTSNERKERRPNQQEALCEAGNQAGAVTT